jgi:hypothetical protein
MRTTERSARWAVGVAVVALLAAIPVFSTIARDEAQANTALPGDGTTSATAGASCWGIKQAHPASADGTYWLSTVALERPQQFHCDMTTAGGGWVLVGRGRQGWTFNPLGQGSPATVRSTVSGPAAFAPAALPTATIDALLNGTALSALPDGVRIERATNTAGTSRQDLRLHPKARAWTWNLPTGQLMNKIVIDGTTYNGSNTYDTSASVTGQTTNQLSGQQGLRRLFTWKWSSHGNQAGFSFGTGISGGSNSATNHLWTNGGEGSPIPFTRVWLRPQIANDAAGFTPLPAAGLPAEPKPVTLKNRSELAPWGVEGYDRTNENPIEPWYSNVFALEDVGDRMFVGGRFDTVRNGPGGTRQTQRFLAAFDLNGTWISSFRPTLDGRVWDMVATDGKLIIAGDFTNVNGAPNTSGIAALDPTTGQVVPGWKGHATDTRRRALVRALHLRDGTIYAVGNFNRYTGGTWGTVSVSNGVSLRASDGQPGPWRPSLPAQGVDVRATQDGTRVLIGGYFDRVAGNTNHGYFAITNAANGAPLPGIGPWTPSHTTGKYQQAVQDLGDGRIVTGGAQHSIHLYDWNRTQMLDSSITKAGGDTQVIELIDGKAYFGCHCGDYLYQGTNSFSNPSGFRSVDPVNLVGAKDIATWEYDTTWYPSSLKGDRGEGVWAIEQDDRKCLWVGGDLIRGRWSGNAASDYLGGFARFCPEDATPPTAPTNLRSAPEGDGATISWGASTDASGTVSYDVYRDDRVIATVWGTSYTDPLVTGGRRYTVRAVDARGNRSAAPAPISVNGAAPKIATAVPFGSTWRYLADGTDQGTAWRAADFADGSWPSGPGLLGWGVAGLGTTFATKPQTAYLRTTFTVPDAASVRLLDLRLRVATGAVVHVNGVEAGRINMPTGRITATTAPTGYISGAEEAKVHALAVPPGVLRNGTNTIAVELHAMTAGARRGFVDLEATLFGAGGDATAPSAPGLTATTGEARVDLTWTPGADDAAVGGYLISRDGQPLAVTGPLATGWVDGEVDLAVAHTYEVRTFDTNGNLSAPARRRVDPAIDPNLLPLGSAWRWTYPAEGAPPGWADPSFVDAGWAEGPGELGFGDSDERTVISTSPAPRPVTAYFRRTVEIADPTAFSAIVAEIVRDDGVVLYVNGIEVGRDNLPAGAIAATTLATAGFSDRAAERAPVTFTLPPSAFRPGANVLAVEVHNADRWSGDLSFDLRLVGRP